VGVRISAAWEPGSAHIQELRLGVSDTLLATFDEDLVWRQLLTSLAPRITCLTRKGNLDAVFILQPYNVFATLTDERRVILTGNLQDFGGFVGLDTSRSASTPNDAIRCTCVLFNLTQDAPFGLLHVVLTTDNLSPWCQLTFRNGTSGADLDPRLLCRLLLFLLWSLLE
jgi:hypothetical protein